MGIPVSLILIAVGAILTWAVNADPEGIDVQVVGVVLMITGLVGLLLTLLFRETWWGPRYFRREAYYDDAAPARRGYGYRGRRRATVVEEDDVPPVDPPAGPPY